MHTDTQHMHTQTQAQIPGSEASRGLALHALAHRAHQICPARNAWGDEYPHTFILSLMLPSNTRINAEPHLVHMIRLIVALEWGQVVVLPPRSSCRRGHACRQHLQVLFVVSRLLSPSQLVKENEKASQQNKKKKKKKEVKMLLPLLLLLHTLRCTALFSTGQTFLFD